MWDYAFFVQHITIKPGAELPQGDALIEALGPALNGCIAQLNATTKRPLPTQPAIELLSHCITPMGQTLLLTILYRYRNS